MVVGQYESAGCGAGKSSGEPAGRIPRQLRASPYSWQSLAKTKLYSSLSPNARRMSWYSCITACAGRGRGTRVQCGGHVGPGSAIYVECRSIWLTARAKNGAQLLSPNAQGRMQATAARPRPATLAHHGRFVHESQGALIVRFLKLVQVAEPAVGGPGRCMFWKKLKTQ